MHRISQGKVATRDWWGGRFVRFSCQFSRDLTWQGGPGTASAEKIYGRTLSPSGKDPLSWVDPKIIKIG